MFESTVAVSKKWDSREAGEEISSALMSKNGRPPSFILLFPTIHYEKHGGFQTLLNAVYSKVPKNVPLVGGTVAGFISRGGSNTQGAVAFAVWDDEMDVAVALGTGTKRRPNLAAFDCAKSIKTALASSKYPNRHFFTMISSANVPTLPFISGRHVIRHLPGINIAARFAGTIFSALQIGPGRDEEVFGAFCKELSGWSGIGGASCDDLRLERNYQFVNAKVHTNSVVALGFAWKNMASQRLSFGLQPTDKKFAVTKTANNGYIIQKINNKPAVPEYLRIMGWDASVLDERLYRKVFYFPFTRVEGDVPEPRMFGLVYGDSFVCPIRVSEAKDYQIYVSDSKDLIDSITGLVSDAKRESGLFISCGTRLETLGNKVEKIREELSTRLTGEFLVLFTAGEYAKNYDMYSVCMYQSDNALLF